MHKEADVLWVSAEVFDFWYFFTEGWMRLEDRLFAAGGRMWGLWRRWFLVFKAFVSLDVDVHVLVFCDMWRW